MKNAAACRCWLVGTRQRIDATAILVQVVGPQALGDKHAGFLTIMILHMQDNFATAIADHHLVTLAQPKGLQVRGVNENTRPALALA